ncbi:MAG TPA: DUF6580 family putative transport protein [Verrucomicrobiae bacterium]|nr:DUF6580 family putative transport protein [Verrucomicrobiae bacterium]
MNIPRFLFLTGIIFVAALSRLIPHPPNFSPIAALALFGGAQFSCKWMAFIVPLAAMFLSDLILGLHALIPVIYGCFALIVCLGFWLRRNQNICRIGGAAIIGAILFFVVTNFGVWAIGSYYPKTGNGLLTCYIEAIPFFWNTLTSDLFYSAILFGALRAAEWRWPIMRPALAAN